MDSLAARVFVMVAMAVALEPVVTTDFSITDVGGFHSHQAEFSDTRMQTNSSEGMSVAALGELRLKWRERPDKERAGKFGRYLGGGDGSFRSRDLSGGVSWDLFENQGKRVCDAFFSGRIVAATGGEVAFEILGYFRRESGSPVWLLTAAIRFSSNEPTYRHYQDRVGYVLGTFDMSTYEHRHQVFLTTEPPSSEV